jgi:hypothetical protein
MFRCRKPSTFNICLEGIPMPFLPAFQQAFDDIKAKLDAPPDQSVIDAAVKAATEPLDAQISDLQAQLAQKVTDETDTAAAFEGLAVPPPAP